MLSRKGWSYQEFSTVEDISMLFRKGGRGNEEVGWIPLGGVYIVERAVRHSVVNHLWNKAPHMFRRISKRIFCDKRFSQNFCNSFVTFAYFSTASDFISSMIIHYNSRNAWVCSCEVALCQPHILHMSVCLRIRPSVFRLYVRQFQPGIPLI